MSDLDRRWQRLVAASRRPPPPDVPPPSPAFLERVARRGRAARAHRGRHGHGQQREPWAWAALVSMASVGALVLSWAREPVQHEAAAGVNERLLEFLAPAPRR